MTSLKNWIFNVIQNQRTDLFGHCARGVLFQFSKLYRLIVRCRNWAYTRNLLQSHEVDAQVISVGNLTTGGTGKTPFVIWLANCIKNSSTVAIVSRGYRSIDGTLNDEGREIKNRIPAVLQIQDKNRVAAAKSAIEELNAKLTFRPNSLQNTKHLPTIILDDGFQHRRLRRDLDIVLIDATNPFGFGHLLPRGLLREEVSEIRRADIAVLTRTNLVSIERRKQIEASVRCHNPKIQWAEVFLSPQGWQTFNGNHFPLEQLKNKKLYAFCGIGNPTAFQKTLTTSGLDLVASRFFEDHQHYSKDDICAVKDHAQQLSCDAIVCTAKDLVKLDVDDFGGVPVFALTTDIEFMSGESQLRDRLGHLLPKLKNAG